MADDYSRVLARIACAQIAEVAGFDACQGSAVEILAELLLKYTSEVCSLSHDYAGEQGGAGIWALPGCLNTALCLLPIEKPCSVGWEAGRSSAAFAVIFAPCCSPHATVKAVEWCALYLCS